MKTLPGRMTTARREMLEDILRINSELGITVLYVTNDYEEAVFSWKADRLYERWTDR